MLFVSLFSLLQLFILVFHIIPDLIVNYFYVYSAFTYFVLSAQLSPEQIKNFLKNSSFTVAANLFFPLTYYCCCCVDDDDDVEPKMFSVTDLKECFSSSDIYFALLHIIFHVYPFWLKCCLEPSSCQYL